MSITHDFRSFLVVADSLQQREGEPPMPSSQHHLVMPSGTTLRHKKKYLQKMLTEDTASSIGLAPYYPYVSSASQLYITRGHGKLRLSLKADGPRCVVLSFFQAKNREPLGVICVLLITFKNYNAPFGFRQNA